jgi:hypothetical protein
MWSTLHVGVLKALSAEVFIVSALTGALPSF